MDGEQRDGLRAFGLLGRLSDGQLRVDDLVEVPHEVADPGQREVTFEPARELKDLAQVEQRSRASVSLRAQLGPAQVSALLEQPVEDIGHGERVAEPADAVRELDQAHRLSRDLVLHLGKCLPPRFFEAVAQAHSRFLEAARGELIHALIRQPHDRALQDADEGSVVHGIFGKTEERQHVLYLLAVEEAGAAAGHVRDALPPQLVFELAGEHADRVRKDRDVAKCASAEVQLADGFSDRARLSARVGCHDHRHSRTSP